MQRKEENNRMGKARDLFKKIRDTKGIYHAKMGTIKDRKGKDLTKAEETKKIWQEYTKLPILLFIFSKNKGIQNCSPHEKSKTFSGMCLKNTSVSQEEDILS